MDPLQAIRTRRSIRVYQDKPVPEELVQQILASAMYAPSAGDARPGQFVVITDRKFLRQIPTVHPHAPMAEQAVFLLVITEAVCLQDKDRPEAKSIIVTSRPTGMLRAALLT